ncbi:glycosyltransferase family 4 protein [Niveispirillum sp. KHB5.9]|uniref:glycosyltransferase family 4 protein n=1 Tax=Niveispirillum sp. KHB5.9 TaxID=3400269 RepID=UPI003A842C8C
MRILLSAYSCNPDRGSEPGVGWGWATALADAGHEVDILTQAGNRAAIEAELALRPRPRLRFHWHQLPPAVHRLKKSWGGLSVRLHYIAWQVSAVPVLRRIAAERGSDLGHHVTFAQYWSFCGLSKAGLPFIWGPVGGGERTPAAFWPDLGVRACLYEAVRALPGRGGFMRSTARGCRLAVASTPETAACLKALGAAHPLTVSQVALKPADLDHLARMAPVPPAGGPFRFIILGDLLAHKGVHLALSALARLQADWRLAVIGDGPCRRRLEDQARRLGIAGRVRFHGALPRAQAWAQLGEAHALLFPALHDSGGMAAAEAMAAGLPVICLALGGPPGLVVEGTGFAMPAPDPATAIAGLAQAAQRLIDEPDLWARLSDGARTHAHRTFTWPARVAAIYGALETAS